MHVMNQYHSALTNPAAGAQQQAHMSRHCCFIKETQAENTTPEVVGHDVLQARWRLLQQLQHRPAQRVQPQLSIVPALAQQQLTLAFATAAATSNKARGITAQRSVFSRSSALYLRHDASHRTEDCQSMLRQGCILPQPVYTMMKQRSVFSRSSALYLHWHKVMTGRNTTGRALIY
jgi:hypothetical protein